MAKKRREYRLRTLLDLGRLEERTPAITAEEPKPKEMKHLGFGRYEMPDGSIVTGGKEKALEALKKEGGGA